MYICSTINQKEGSNMKYQKKVFTAQNCKECKKPFIPKNSLQKFCKVSCRRKYEYEEKRKEYYGDVSNKFASRGDAGAYAELAVAMDLLIKKYHVFRAVSPHSSCDIVALKNDICYRVEVRTAVLNRKTGKLSLDEKGEHDILAGVIRKEDGKYQIVYKPELTKIRG